MMKNKLSIVVAMVIATAMPAAPCSAVGKFDDNPFQSKKLRSIYSNALESCPKLSDNTVERQVNSCVEKALSEIRRDGQWMPDRKKIEIVCNNRESLIPCQHPYNALLKDCWSLKEDNVETGRSIKDDSFCKILNNKLFFESSEKPGFEACLASFGNQTDNCVEETAKQTGIEITFVPNHTDFCRTSIIINDCLPKTSTRGCDTSLHGDYISHFLKAISKAGGCSTAPYFRQELFPLLLISSSWLVF